NQGGKAQSAGESTVVTLGGVPLAQVVLNQCAPDEIVLSVPSDLRRGPVVRLTVSAGGEQSAPASFEVRPWISSLRPLRGIGGVPLAIPFEVSTTTTVAIEFDGQ